MNPNEREFNQKICDDMTQLQADWESALKEIIAQVGNKLKPEKRKEISKEISPQAT